MSMDFALASASDPNALPSWAPLAIQLGAALLALFGVVLAVVLRKPVQVTELWTENRGLRSELDEMHDENSKMRSDYNAMDLKFTSQLRQVLRGQQIVGGGFVALSETVEEAQVKLNYTPERKRKIEAARDFLANEAEWPTIE